MEFQPLKPWYIAFEGPIAAGKTTLAKLFSEATGAQLLLEDFACNEFLADFYRDKNRWAFPMQLDFLISRHDQFSSCTEDSVSIVSDHTFEKDLIFAGLLLRGREFRLYQAIHRSLKHPTRKPNLIVYLDAPDEVLLRRIRQRNRSYETAITANYLGLLREAYSKELFTRLDIRIIHEDTCALDLKSDVDLAALHDRILKSIPTKSTQEMFDAA